MKKIKSLNWRMIIGVILFASLVISLIFSIINLIKAPTHQLPDAPFTKVKSDYVLMVVQCFAASVVMFLPSLIERKWKIEIPNFMYILYFIFLYCAVYLGEVQNFYYSVPNWDTILHVFSGIMLGALGFSLVTILNDAKRVKLQLNPFFIACFAFCFAMAVGAIWEIYEYTMDGILSLNMQKYALEDGTLLIGRPALQDTMKDLIVNTLGALLTSIIGYISLRRRRSLPLIDADVLSVCADEDGDTQEKTKE